MGFRSQQVQAAVDVLTTRYDMTAGEASAMLTEWARRTRLSAATVASWVVDDGGAAAERAGEVAAA